MQNCAVGLFRLSIEPHDKKLSGCDACVGWKRPLCRIGVIRSEIKPVETDCVRSRIVEFDPRVMLAEVVARSSKVLALHFVQPERGKFRKHCANERIGSAGCAREGWTSGPICDAAVI